MALQFLAQLAAPILGGIANRQAGNRGSKLSAQMDLERILMDRDQQQFSNTVTREQEGRASGTDAWRKLIASERTGNPGPRPSLSPYSVAPRQTSEREMFGAHMQAEEAMKRLVGGNPIAAPQMRPLEVDRKLMNPGRMEQIFGWLAPILGAAGQYRGGSSSYAPPNGGGAG